MDMSGIFLFVLNMSITAAYAAGAIILVRLLLKRQPKIFSYSLWGILLLRLVCPVSFSSVFSFFNLFRTSVQENPAVIQYIPTDIGMMKQPAVDTGISSINHIINPILPKAQEFASVNPMQIIIFLASVIWIMGIVVLIICGAVAYAKTILSVRTAVMLDDSHIDEIRGRMKLKRRIKVYTTDRIDTPFVCGFILPRIYMPVHVSEKEISYILAHEMLHIKRLDYLAKPFSYLLLAVHWFNPILWLSFSLMGRDMEMSCDERVMGILGSGIKHDYSNSLLSLAVRGNRILSLSPLSFGESDAKSRIKNILNFKRPSFYITAVIIILICCAGFALISNPGHILYNDEDTNQTLLNTVSEIEKSTYELNTLKISYADFKKSTDKYLSKYFTSFYTEGNNIYAENGFVKDMTGKDYTEKDWAGMSFEEIKKIGEVISPSIAINKISYNYKSCGISKVYDDSISSSLQKKTVFVRRDVHFDNTNTPIDEKIIIDTLVYVKYTFFQDGKSYVLQSLKYVYVPQGQELTYGNEKVDFVQNINLQ